MSALASPAMQSERDGLIHILACPCKAITYGTDLNRFFAARISPKCAFSF
jgi:hypothetical protein